MFNKGSRNKGLTLIELIAVIVLLGIISGIATFLIGNIIPNMRQKADIATLSSINSATDFYRYNQEESSNDLFLDDLTDSEKLELLFEEGYLSKFPNNQKSGNEFVFQSETQLWVIVGSEDEITYTPTAEEYFSVSETQEYTLVSYDLNGGLNVVIPQEINGVQITTIGSTCFTDLGIMTVIINEGITRVSGNSFKNNDLTSIVFPDSVERIWHNAFNNNQLTSVTFGSGLKRLEGGSFGNNELTTISLPDSVEYVGEGAFGYGENFIVEIQIGSNVEIGNDTSFGWYGKSFRTLYNISKESGTYIYSDGEWAKQA